MLVHFGHLADHGAAVVNELSQHHGYVVVDGGGVVRPLGGVSHKRPQSEHSRTPHLRQHRATLQPSNMLYIHLLLVFVRL